MNKKTIVILGVILSVLFVVVISVLLLKKKSPSPSTQNGDGFDITIKNQLPQVTVPTSDSITLTTRTGDVQVKNFYKFAKFIVSPSVYIVDNKNYTIVYSESTEDFLIDLYAYSATEAKNIRPAAEAEFLASMGITKQDACKLPVIVEVPFSYSQDLANKNYKLSFCPLALNF